MTLAVRTRAFLEIARAVFVVVRTFVAPSVAGPKDTEEDGAEELRTVWRRLFVDLVRRFEPWRCCETAAGEAADAFKGGAEMTRRRGEEATSIADKKREYRMLMARSACWRSKAELAMSGGESGLAVRALLGMTSK